MNPMNRRMFRDPMAARQASGILASSPQLANVVQQRQPVRMQTGGNVDTKMIQAIQQLAANGQTGTLNEIAADTRNSRAVRSAAANALVGAQKASTSIPLASSDETRMAVNRGNLASLRSKAAPQISGPILDSDMSAGNPVTSRNLSIDVDPSMAGASTADSMQAAMNQKASDTPLFAGIGNAVSGFVDKYIAGSGPRPSVDGRKNLIRPDQIRNVLFPGSAQERQDKIASDTGENIDFSPATSPSSFIPDVPDGSQTSATPSGITSTSVASNVLNDSMDNAVGPASNVVSRATAGAGEQLSNLAAYTTPDESGAGTEPTSTKSAAEKATLTSPTTKSSQDKQLILTPKVVDSITNNKSPEAADNATTAALSKGQELVKKGLDILQGEDSASTSEKEKAEKIDAAVGITGTYKERVQKRAEVLKDLLGDREKDVRTDANYNLMMAGLLIASGESPDAMTNLAKGLAMGLKGYGDAIGEEAKSISKEDRALVVQAASEVGAEISSEKAAQIRASENALTRAHEKKMQDIRLGTSLLTAGAQMESAQAMQNQRLNSQEKISLANLLNQKEIADANIKSRELINSNTLEQNADMFNLGNQFKEDINEANNKLKKELAELTNESETMKLMKLIQSDHLARTGEKLPDIDALAAVKASSASTKKTDTQRLYTRLLNVGYGAHDALILSSSGTLAALVKDLGPEGLDKYLAEKIAGGNEPSEQNKVDSSTENQLPSFKKPPSSADLESLSASGVTQIEVNGKIFKITQQ